MLKKVPPVPAYDKERTIHTLNFAAVKMFRLDLACASRFFASNIPKARAFRTTIFEADNNVFEGRKGKNAVIS